MWNKVAKYFSKHVVYSSMVHVIGGVGIGIILARPMAADHPMRWGLALIAVSLLAHVYPLWMKK